MRRLGLILALVVSGCSSDSTGVDIDPPPASYAVSGIVFDEEGEGIPAVTLDFGSFGTATSGLDGVWSKSGLQGLVTITPTREGWGFSPGSLDVDGPSSSIGFEGAPITTRLEVVVEWEKVGGTGSGVADALPQEGIEPTHFGTRLEYPDESAIFAQSLTRDAADELGLITLQVPPAEAADLFVAAVKLVGDGPGQPGQRDPVVAFGQVRGVEIVEGSSTIVRMEDIEWGTPLWDFESEDVRAAYEDGVMSGDKDETWLEFTIKVRDPFGDRVWVDFVGLNGASRTVSAESDDEWWTVGVLCRNELVGQENDSVCRFWSFLRAERFNLPEIRFSVPPQTNDFVVEWR